MAKKSQTPKKQKKKKRKREMVMKDRFWQVYEISRRLHRLKSKGEPHGTHEKS